MSRSLDTHSRRFSALGRAGVDVLRAEAALITGELRGTGASLLRIVLLLLVALFVLFWALAVFVYLGIEVGSLWLPRWAAALIVLGALLLIAVVVGLVAWRRARRLETPAETLRRRLGDHRDWWHRRLGGRAEEPEPRAGGESR